MGLNPADLVNFALVGLPVSRRARVGDNVELLSQGWEPEVGGTSGGGMRSVA
jgi:hypothetical protein